MHIGSQLFDLEPWRLAVEAIATLGDFGAYDLGGGLAVAYTPTAGRRRSPSTSSTMLATADELLGPGKALSIEPGRALVATAGVTLYTRRVGQGRRPAGRPGPLRRRRRGHVGQHAPDALRRALRGRPRPTAWARTGTPCTVVGKHCESGDVLIRETHAARARGPGDVLATPVTGAYVYAMANNYNGVPRAAGRVLLATAARGSSSAARPSRTCMPETYRVGLLGHGTVGAAFEALLAERADAIAAHHRLQARAQRRAHALARRLRRDPGQLAT